MVASVRHEQGYVDEAEESDYAETGKATRGYVTIDFSANRDGQTIQRNPRLNDFFNGPSLSYNHLIYHF
jgi:hypothetical protein